MSHLDMPVRAPLRASAPRVILGGLLALVALNAFGGGLYGMAGAREIPTAWLVGSPFSDYFVPSLFLFFVVGGSQLAAAIAVLARARCGRNLALGAGAILLTWIAAQVAVIGYVSWMQPTIAATALVVLALARTLSTRTGCAARSPRCPGRRSCSYA